MKNFNLPDNTWDGDPNAPWNSEHFKGCPLHDDADSICAECGTIEAAHPHGCGFVEDKNPKCECADIEDNKNADKADAAEAQAAALKDRLAKVEKEAREAFITILQWTEERVTWGRSMDMIEVEAQRMVNITTPPQGE